MIKKNIEEFKKFIARGNVIELAVGVIIGGAFSSIVTSLVNNILTPILGITFKDTRIEYGAFIQSIIDFLIVAICIFTLVKIINRLMHIKKKEEEKEAPAPLKREEVVLLEEIRDLLKENKPNKKEK